METRGSIGYLIGAIVGTVATGVCIYLTGRVFSALICLVCAIIGGNIGKTIKKAKE